MNSNREFNKTIDDPCAIQQRNDDNNKKLKFITTNHRDLLDGKKDLNFFGMTLKDSLFVPADQIDRDSTLRLGEGGNVITKNNVRQGFGPLPMPTMPGRYQMYHGNVQTEDSMRNQLQANRKSCNPRDTGYHNRSFYIFDDSKGIETPNATRSVEDGPRGGVSTRFFNSKRK
jgi:hypothetical protein